MASSSLATATKKSKQRSKADQLDWLDGLGVDGNAIVDEKFMTQSEAVCAEFIERVSNDIPADSFVTGNMQDSLYFEVTKNEIAIYGAPYLMYQNSGVQGSKDKSKAPNSTFSYTDKMPPAKVFADWIVRKNIMLRNEENYDGKPSPFGDLNNERLIMNAAWGMSRKIFLEGFKGSFFLSKNIPFLIEGLTDAVEDFALDMIDIKIDTKLGNKLKGSRLSDGSRR